MKQRLKASALLSSMLVLTTCLLFIYFYQEMFLMNGQSNLLLLEYLK